MAKRATPLAALALALGLGLGACGRTAPSVAKARDPGAPLPCVYFWPEARARGYGYDHIVHVQNGCSRPAVCDVSTNLNPGPIRVRVEPREHREVLTFRGSPAREFVPTVRCWLD